MTAKLDEHPSAALGWISHAALAAILGKRTTRSARDWCQAHGVPYKRDGKTNWCRLEDVRAAIEAIGAAPGTSPRVAAANDAMRAWGRAG